MNENIENKNYIAERMYLKFKTEKKQIEEKMKTCELIIDEYQKRKIEFENMLKLKQTVLVNSLESLIEEEDCRSSKTQLVYETPSGMFVKKKEKRDITLKSLDPDLVDEKYIKTKKSIDWANYKKVLSVDDNDNIINTETGEVVDNCEVKIIPRTEWTIK